MPCATLPAAGPQPADWRTSFSDMFGQRTPNAVASAWGAELILLDSATMVLRTDRTHPMT
jgi:hypothetical protein